MIKQSMFIFNGMCPNAVNDKQIIRDYLLSLDWDQTCSGPVLPDSIVKKDIARYKEIYEIITG